MNFKKNNLVIEYIDNQAALKQCVDELKNVSEFAFDLEFDRDRYRYGFNLCLIQIATSTKCFVIDPIAKVNLNELFRVFEDEKILKVVHCPGEDLRLLHSINCFPKNVFDTEISAKLLDYPLTSLLAILETKLKIKIDKGQQKSNWNMRPLTEEQIFYAANDVIYLLELKNQLEQEAIEKGLIDFLQEEFEFLSTTIYTLEEKENYLKRDDLTYLSPYHQFKLNELFEFRDSLAKKFDRPAYQIIDEQILRGFTFDEIDIEEWEYLRGLIWKVKTNKYKNELIKKLEEINRIADKENLSKELPVNRVLSDEEISEIRKANKELDNIRAKKFIPIQKEITKLYGINTSKYILGEGVITDLLKKKISFGQIKREYKKQIIKSIADKLNINLDQYM